MPADADGRTLPREDLAAMLELARPDWELREATPAEGGRACVHHLRVATGDGHRSVVLKAAPDDDEGFDVATEARIQAVVDAHTGLPVPAVLGVVDEHDDLRAPFFLMEQVPGETLSRWDTADLPDGTLRAVARETGRHLADVHALAVDLDAYGPEVGYERAETLRGGRPTADPARLVGSGGHERWADQLRTWFEGDLDLVADSRFSDLEPHLRETLARQIAAMPEAPDTVFARVDHHWENLVLEREAGALAGVIDWGETTMYPRSLSLALVEWMLARDWWMVLPEVPDRRPLVRDALLAGYREAATVPDTYPEERACYQCSTLVRDPGLFERRVVEEPAFPDERVEAAADHLRATLEREVARVEDVV